MLVQVLRNKPSCSSYFPLNPELQISEESGNERLNLGITFVDVARFTVFVLPLGDISGKVDAAQQIGNLTSCKRVTNRSGIWLPSEAVNKGMARCD